MARLKKQFTALILGALLLTGCSSTDDSKPQPTSKQSDSAVDSALKPDIKEPHYYELICSDSNSPAKESHKFKNYQEVWESVVAVDSCSTTGDMRGDYFTDEQYSAIQETINITENFKTYQELCAVMHLGTYSQADTLLSMKQMEDIRRALIICPDQPGKNLILAKFEASQANIDRLAEIQQQRESGVRFGPGLFKVNESIQPGYYVSEGNFEGCYWERLDATGNIIDNNFINRAFRVEVEILPSDFSFSSRGCGEFVKQ